MAAVSKTEDPSTAHHQSQHQEESLVKKLHPFKRKLDRTETEQIYRILQATVWNVKQAEVVSWLLEDDANVSRVEDERLRKLLIRHQQIGILSNLQSDDGMKGFQFSLKSILRYCSENNIVLSSYQPESTSNLQSSIVKQLEKLVKLLLDRLLTSRDEENCRQKFLLEIMEKRRSLQKVIASLEHHLEDKVNETSRLFDEKDDIIEHFSTDIETTQFSSDRGNTTVLSNAARLIMNSQRAFEDKSKKILQDIILFREKGAKTTKEYYDHESKLRKRKFKLAGELQNWVAKYDQDMGWRQTQIDEIATINDSELEETRLLEKYLITLEKDYNFVVEERRTKTEAREKEEKDQKEANEAAVKIQALWRGHRLRKQMKKKKKGKKGGKKKKK